MTLRDALAARRGQGSGPILLFLAGPNGAGKTTFFETHLADLGLPFVNADRIAAALRSSSPQRAGGAVERAAFAQAEDFRRAFLQSNFSFCTETVFSDPVGAKVEFLKEAGRTGFTVFLVFIGLASSMLSRARVMQRVSQGGHDIPDDKLRARFPRTLANLRAAIPVVDEAFLFDNSSVDRPYRAIATYTSGELVARHPPLPKWTHGLPGL